MNLSGQVLNRYLDEIERRHELAQDAAELRAMLSAIGDLLREMLASDDILGLLETTGLDGTAKYVAQEIAAPTNPAG